MSSEAHHHPRVGVPWRTAKEEKAGQMAKMENYLRAVSAAGGEPILISLAASQRELERLMGTLDAVVLPGSSADVDPARYGARRRARCADPDSQRERADYALLDHAFAAKKPVLAICYGVQLLNVYLGGTLVQDISSELRTQIRHDKRGLPAGAEDPRHAARIEPGCRLAEFAGAVEVEVNSSHHQAILVPGKHLRITAHAPDGVIEAVEWTGTGNWVMGVQWHPERMRNGRLAEALFRDLIAAARGTPVQD